MKNIKQIKIGHDTSCNALVEQFAGTGVLGGGKLAHAVEIMHEILEPKNEYYKILSWEGPLVAAGFREVFTDAIREGHVDMIITNGASAVHDVIESLGLQHIQGDFHPAGGDEELHRQGFGRMGNALVPIKAFASFEDFCQAAFKEIFAKRDSITIRELFWELGARVKDEKSILHQAFRKKIPIYSPGFHDSMLGLQLAFFKQDNPRITVDAIGDMIPMKADINAAKRVGAIIIGGGIPKHYTLASTVLRNGIDAAVNFTSSPEWDGTVSSASLEEGKSWGKAKENAKLATVRGDPFVSFALAWAAVLERLKK
ncbi:MAG TPA: deoxyhypusine synthase family protein [Candidatus Norongarragalinales archaeon]|jgi:deoxyhypusine synthase|nr:deoxyhypusine synthase family protein [Candidatus Norongarragalinales archaeon]